MRVCLLSHHSNIKHINNGYSSTWMLHALVVLSYTVCLRTQPGFVAIVTELCECSIDEVAREISHSLVRVLVGNESILEYVCSVRT